MCTNMIRYYYAVIINGLKSLFILCEAIKLPHQKEKHNRPEKGRNRSKKKEKEIGRNVWLNNILAANTARYMFK